MTVELVWKVQLTATLAMTGVIWFVQLVHYPLFGLVGPEHFALYARQHNRLTTRLVAPLMLIEAGSAVWLLCVHVNGHRDAPLWVGLGLLVLAWLSTALVQVPCHRRLCQRFDAADCDWLLRTNWLRTTAWTSRSVLLLWAGPESILVKMASA